MAAEPRRWWPIVKALLSLIILAFVGRRFAADLANPELYREPVEVAWLAAAGLLYLAGLGMACWYWAWLLGRLGPRPGAVPIARAYYASQLGKYVPGKALTLVMRAAMARRAGVSAWLAGMTAFYEVLTTMASGVLLATAVYLAMSRGATSFLGAQPWGDAWAALAQLKPPPEGLSPPTMLFVCVLLLAAVAWPIVPPIFNRLAERLSLPFRDPTAIPPQLRWSQLLVGLAFGAAGWVLMGLALACGMHAVDQAGLPWVLPTLAHLLAILAVAYVASFLVLVSPGGLGVRELFLSWLLTPEVARANDLSPELAAGKVALVVVLLRLAWTAAEVVLAGLLYWTKER
jgi:hypothetical protein